MQLARSFHPAGTVKSHMTAIMAKLGAASSTQAVAIAIRRGLIGRVPAAEHGLIAT